MAVTATTTTATGSISDDAVDFFIKTAMEKHGESTYRMRANLAGDVIPSGNSKNIKFVRFPRIVLAGTLTEGATPTFDSWDIETVTATAVQLGQVLDITDVAELTLKHPLAQRAMEELAESAARKDDQLIQDVLGAGSNVFYGNGAASRAALAATDYVRSEELRDIVMQLEVGTDGVDGAAPRFPNGTYKGILHTKHVTDLLSDADVSNLLFRQPSGEDLRMGRLGMWNGVDIIKNNFAPQFSLEALGSSADAAGGTTYDNAATIKYGVTRVHKKRGFEEGIDDAGTNVMSANKDLDITAPADTNYTYNIYSDSAADGSGTRKLFASGVAASAVTTVTSLPTGATIPAAPASGVTVYRSYVFGQRAASVVDLASLQTFLNRGSSKFDPANQLTTMATKWFDKAVILNDAWLAVLEAPSRH
jgi:N4-gp56 family major capsid protein